MKSFVVVEGARGPPRVSRVKSVILVIYITEALISMHSQGSFSRRRRSHPDWSCPTAPTWKSGGGLVEKWKQDRTDVPLPINTIGPAFHGIDDKDTANHRPMYTVYRVSSSILHMSSVEYLSYDVGPPSIISSIRSVQHPRAEAVQPFDDQGPS